MKRVLVLLLLPLAFLLFACSPAETPAPLLETTTPRLPLATEGAQPVAQATSRGDKLEASDPASVKYGAGRPVLIEFFRFT